MFFFKYVIPGIIESYKDIAIAEQTAAFDWLKHQKEKLLVKQFINHI